MQSIVKNLTIVIISSLLLINCAQPKVQDTVVLGCKVEQVQNKTTITCPNGDIATISNGHSSVNNIIDATTSQCSNGGSIILMATDSNDNGTFDLDDDNIQSATICNGVAGVDGQNGKDATLSPYTPVGIVTPCGPNSSSWKEVLLILNDGSLLASFSETQSGYNTRLSFIPDGTYMDTDSSGCIFTVSTTDHTRTVSWNGGSQSWSIL